MLIVLNGPPGVGKDTIGTLLSAKLGCPMLSFKKPMWDIAEALLGKEIFKDFVAAYHDRERKEVPSFLFGNLSPRQLFIHISEQVCKPLFGDRYFGMRMMGEYDSNQHDYYQSSIVTDGGFPKELFPFLENHVPVVIVELYRDGFTFAGDSRDYLKPEQFAYYPAHIRPSFIRMELVEGEAESAAAIIAEAVRSA